MLAAEFLRDPIKMLTQISRTYGDISHFKLGKRHVYFINNPEFIEKILVRDQKYFIKSRGLQLSKRLLGEGLLTSEGEFHDRQRKIIQPAFHPNRIKTYGGVMTGYAEEMCRRWGDGAVLDIHKEMMQVTSAIISKAVLGSDIQQHLRNGGNNSNDSDALLTSMEYLNRLQMPFGELIERIPILPLNKGFKAAKNELDSIVYSMIGAHKSDERGRTDDDESKNSDLLFTLLHAQDPEAGIGKMSDSQLRDEVMTIFLAGHETTANALTWTFYLLSQYPEVESRVYDELSSVLGVVVDGNDDNNSGGTSASTSSALRTPTVDDVPRLEYVEKVFREAMRLFPPAWAIGRQVVGDDDYAIDKYAVSPGSIILMSQYVMHHYPRYFTDPELFYPDRWTKQFKSSLPRFSYFPFGGGVRGCIGEPFAWMEGILLIATVCSQWKMRHAPTHTVDLKPLITLRPKHGMVMKLEKRKRPL
jgi:cytochrome P450